MGDTVISLFTLVDNFYQVFYLDGATIGEQWLKKTLNPYTAESKRNHDDLYLIPSKPLS